MSTRYVMRILADTNADENHEPVSPHLERWVAELDCQERGIVTTDDPQQAVSFTTHDALRRYWLQECEPGKPWDWYESGIPGDGHSQPLIRYIVWFETLNEARKLAEQEKPQARLERRMRGNG